MKKWLPVFIVFAFAGVLFAGVAEAGTFYTYALEWGSSGTGNGQFGYFDMRSVAADSSGNVYVADTNNMRIQKFDSNGNFLLKWGSYGPGNGQFHFDWPSGYVAVDSAGNVYVADTDNNRIQKFDSNGNWLATWGVYWGGGPTAPLSLAVDSSGNIFVFLSNSCMQKLDPSGHLLVQWGSYGSGNGQFNGPLGIAVDGSGNVYVADTGNNRIQKFDSNGNWLATWTSNVGNPRSVAVDSSGNVYVASTYNIVKFDSNGNLLIQFNVPTPSSYGPWGVAVNGPGSNVYVLAPYDYLIKKFVASGALTATVLYNGQPLQNAYAYLVPGNQMAPGRHYQSAVHILGPSDANGNISADVIPGPYFVRITKRAGSASVYGPPYPGDYTWTASTPPIITVASNQTTNLGMVNTTIYGAPIKISGTVKGASGKVLPGWAVKAAAVPCESGNWAYAHSFNECGSKKYMAYTDASGNYTINLKNAGTYYVYASPNLDFANTNYPGGYPTCTISAGCEACGDYFYYNCPISVNGPLAGQNIVVPGY